jgi:rod shape-determining protein MreB
MNLLSRFFGSTLYVQLAPVWLIVRNPRSGFTLAEPPEVALAHDPKPRILAVGAAARHAANSHGARLLNPFAHPRSMVSDFTLGQQVLKAFFQRMSPKALLTLPPHVVFHLLGEPAGGFTQVEIRAFHEMAIGAGARRVTVWQGAAVSDQQLLTGSFPRDGSILS